MLCLRQGQKHTLPIAILCLIKDELICLFLRINGSKMLFNQTLVKLLYFPLVPELWPTSAWNNIQCLLSIEWQSNNFSDVISNLPFQPTSLHLIISSLVYSYPWKKTPFCLTLERLAGLMIFFAVACYNCSLVCFFKAELGKKGRQGVVEKLTENRSNEGNLCGLCVCFHGRFSPYTNERWSGAESKGGIPRRLWGRSSSGFLSPKLSSALRSVTMGPSHPPPPGAACKQCPSSSLPPLGGQV